MTEPAMAEASLQTPAPRRPDLCPVEDWLAFLGHRWNALVLWHLSVGARRHGELIALLPGITAKVLSERLDGLMQRGLINRHAVSTFPRGVVYALSDGGRQVVAILDRFETLPSSFREPRH
ncbi:winged helix-turn-helix transcriptional regulator [Mesorhizobium sp. NPDC059054]|uniref:winged helix-turn-helix transcriptional regulator n=1 Tax=unclassified Mesorhizobium TaxID=325217 RepID=UPI0006C757CC|nr:helix-turn-helix domain-containing protein [Mesorhizobium sp. 1M-11]